MAGLAALEADVARDLELTAHPRTEWMVPRLHTGKPALDVLIVGGGQSGLVTAFGLMREPVRNDVAATAIAPGRLDDGGPCLLVTLSTGEVLATRKLVLATGQDGTGEWWMPDFVRDLPADWRAHTCELAIDFARLKGKVVAVLGAGASAMDNAAVALEHGAEVHLFTRRRPTGIQPFRWLTFAGFMRHLGDMPDLWRWRFMANILNAREGFPADTYARVMAFPDTFTMHAERAWTNARMED